MAGDERVAVAGYSGRSVLLDVGEGDRSRVLIRDAATGDLRPFEPGYLARGSGPTALVGVDLLEPGGRCRTRVFPLADPGAGWQLCREGLVAFAPGGEHTLSVGAIGAEVVVRDAGTGREEQDVDVDEYVRASGWESPAATLHVTPSDDGTRTHVIRCLVDTGRCATAVTFPYADRIPIPVRPVDPTPW